MFGTSWIFIFGYLKGEEVERKVEGKRSKKIRKEGDSKGDVRI